MDRVTRRTFLIRSGVVGGSALAAGAGVYTLADILRTASWQDRPADAKTLVLVTLYVNAAVTHLFAVLLGQNKRGFAATFTACAYAFAPLVLFAIPGCGAPIAVVWAAILTGIGLKHTHRIGPGGAAATVIAPYVLVCCGGCALAGLFVAGSGVLPR